MICNGCLDSDEVIAIMIIIVVVGGLLLALVMR